MPSSVLFPDAKIIFFDAGMTLIRPRKGIPELCLEVARRLGCEIAVGEIEALVGEADAFYQSALGRDPFLWSRESSIRDMWYGYYSLIFRRLGLDGHAEQAAEAVYGLFNEVSQWVLFPDVMPTLEELKSRGYRIGVISDWGYGLVANILLPLGLGGYLDPVVVSARVGAAKPSWDLFHMALKRASVRPEEALHVGDSYVNDVLGARSAGMHPLLIDRTGELSRWRLDCQRIQSLAHLLAMVP